MSIMSKNSFMARLTGQYRVAAGVSFLTGLTGFAGFYGKKNDE